MTEEKKMLLKLIFKFIKVENGKIKEYQFFEPFKTLYEGGKLKWTETKENVSTLLHTADLLFRLYNTLYSFFQIQ